MDIKKDNCDKICDFCLYVKILKDEDGAIEDSFCLKHFKEIFLSDQCDDFVCFYCNWAPGKRNPKSKISRYIVCQHCGKESFGCGIQCPYCEKLMEEQA